VPPEKPVVPVYLCRARVVHTPGNVFGRVRGNQDARSRPTCSAPKQQLKTNSERRVFAAPAAPFLRQPGMRALTGKSFSDVGAARMGFAEAFAFNGLPKFSTEIVALDAATSQFPRDLDLSIFAGRRIMPS